MLLLSIIVGANAMIAQEKYGNCEDWDIVPYLYNDSVNPNTEVCLWKNYWYEPDTSDGPYFPDTLIVYLHLIPSQSLWGEKPIEKMDLYHIESTLYFVLGENIDSYNMINKKISEPFQLLDSVIDFKYAFDYCNRINSGFVEIPCTKIPMRKILRSFNVFTNFRGDWIDSIDGLLSPSLNEVIIKTQIYTKENEVCRRFDFVLPVNGPYCNGGDIRRY